MIANHRSSGKPLAANSTYSRIAVYRLHRILNMFWPNTMLSYAGLPQQTTSVLRWRRESGAELGMSSEWNHLLSSGSLCIKHHLGKEQEHFVIISMLVAYFGSLSLVRCIRTLGHYNTRKISNFQNIPEAAQTTCFIMTWMSAANSASVSPVRRLTAFVY